MNDGLLDKLKDYSESDFYPFHMPGHKRNFKKGALAEAYRYDITEIDGFDNLHQPMSLIKKAQEHAARLYRSEETYFLINGSTAGILSAISAVAGGGRNLIISRNCHKAVYHAAFLNRMKLHYVYPEKTEGYDIAGPVLAAGIEKQIKNILGKEEFKEKDAGETIAGIVITSPTYEGINSNIKEISKLAHSYKIPLIVDQAHGAHFGMHPQYPPNAVEEGADIVIHSVHKTLPAPTQTALIHRNGSLTDREVLKRYLRIYQSSSPSYLLMAGIDEAMRFAEAEGSQRLEKLLDMRELFFKQVESCRYIRVCPVTEPGKLVISVDESFMSGQMLYDILREKYHLQMEMAAGSYVVAILTMMDEKSGLDRLSEALLEIDEGTIAGKRHVCRFDFPANPVAAMDLWEAYALPYEEKALLEAAGKTAAEFINLYPPGIPLLVPGEIIGEGMIRVIEGYIINVYTVQGISDNKIKIVKSI